MGSILRGGVGRARHSRYRRSEEQAARSHGEKLTRLTRVGLAGKSARTAQRPLLRFRIPPRTHVRSASDAPHGDRKSTRLNSSHDQISYAVFCLKKKKINNINSD